MLKNKTIVLGITGGIAAYKAVDLASKLTQAGARVEVVMTEAATKFVTPLTLRNITHRQVVTDMYETASEWSEEHIALAEAAAAVVIAPATANTIARLATGIADNMLGTVVLATKAPVIIAPAMNDAMYTNSVTQKNITALKARGFTFIEPEYGRLASGKTGKGRLPDTATIIKAIEKALGQKQDLKNKRIVVTAGGTREPIDPVRHIGNRSSGKMGYALSEAARDRGAKVTLVAANVTLEEPSGVDVIKVKTASEMKRAVSGAVKKADALIMAAAPADYQPEIIAEAKIKKEAAQTLTLKLVKTPDILREVQGDFLRVGFAAESENIIANAKKKLIEKRLDLIVANDITKTDSGFDADTNRIIIIDKKGKAEKLPLMSKREAAERILDRVRGLAGQGGR
ncbi:MAG: bifunctional phosphopantothenoylcysteine decarboxylase/phosphopantothenate--cysteine ligase CoaBC [Dehalococcoidales bacterium]|nr:bifunctional phosphopantothenoylcysteine decarboxylase/phosphopantothenate--cysteine ligase CoaBC [Dehalococcoidales bacterium]